MDALIPLLLVVVILNLVTATPDDDFSELQESFGKWRLSLVPEFSTRKGFYEFNDVLESYDVSDFDVLKAKSEEFKVSLNAIEYNELSEELQISYDILSDNIQALIDGYKWRFYAALNPINFLEVPSYSISSAPFNTRGDFENYINRLEAYPTQLSEITGRMKLAVEKGHTYHNASMAKVPGILDSMISSTVENSRLFGPFNESLDSLKSVTDDIKRSMRIRGRAAISEIFKSMRTVKTYIETEYMNNLRPTLGVVSWDQGKEFYTASLQWFLTVKLTPEQVHQIGLEEVERIYSNMKQVLKRLNFGGSVREFFQSIAKDPRFTSANKTLILKKFDDMIQNEAIPKLPLYFKNIPDVPIEVKESPGDGSFAYYKSSPDGKKPATFFVNLYRPTQLPFTDFMALSLHEAVPGHHLQISLMSDTDLPTYIKYRDSNKYFQAPFRFPFNTGYIEGWGLYAEYLGEEMGLYKDDYSLMGRYSLEIFRACRLVVDTGIHYYNWTKDEALDYFMNYTSMGRGSLSVEVDRYSTWPGQACAYKIGEMKIKELRKKAETELGNKFDIRDFHHIVLKYGAIPLNSLETIVNKWIEDVKQNKKPAASEDCISGAVKISVQVLLYAIVLVGFKITLY